MRTLPPAERRARRAAAHHLHPVVSIGQHGLTPAVLHEIEIALAAHELVKIRVFNDDRGEREALLARICDALDAAPVQHLGKILTVWRPVPEPVAPVVKSRKQPPSHGDKSGRSKPQGEDRRRRAAPAAPRGTLRSWAGPASDAKRTGRGKPAAGGTAAGARRRKPALLGKPSGKRGGGAPPAGGRAQAHGPAPGARRRRTQR